MSDDTTFDPFASDDPFAGIDFDLAEVEDGTRVKVWDEGAAYVDPTTVGLEDGMWIPVRLMGTAFQPKFQPRFPKKTVVAVVKGQGGARDRMVISADQVAQALRNGAERHVTEGLVPFFTCDANHVAPEFGQRRYPYEIQVPAVTVEMMLDKPRNGRESFKNESGTTLRKASGVTKKGEEVSMANGAEIADRMDGQVVMAQVTLTSKNAQRVRRDDAGEPVTVLVDPESGTPVTVFKTGEGDDTQIVLNDGSGTVWDGNPALLVPVADNVFAISDSSDSSAPLNEEYVKVTDYIKDRFLPVPEMSVDVEMAPQLDEDGKPVKGEDGSPLPVEVMSGQITWATVGVIAVRKNPGDRVDVLLRDGRKITAVWMGTLWSEVVPDGGTGGGLDEFAAVKDL